MASSKRQPGKTERYRQNRRARDARAARSARAGEATAIGQGQQEPVRSEPRTAARGPAQDSGERKSARELRREALARRYSVPGQRAVTMALMFAVVSALTLVVTPLQFPRDVPVEDPRAAEQLLDDEDDDGLVEIGEGVEVERDSVEAQDFLRETEANDEGLVEISEDERLFDEVGIALGLAVLLVPIAICGVALYFTKRDQRTRVWTICLFVFAAFIFLFAGSFAILSIAALIALAVANFQNRRVETGARVAEVRAARKSRAADEVIEVDATEVDGGEVDATGGDDD